MSGIPIDLKGVKESEVDKELLRASLVSELDAINLYEQCAATTKDEDMKNVYLDIIKEEKTHIGEFQALLLKRDQEQEQELVHGDKEVDDLTEEESEEE
jgi:rubrerythrin